MLSASNRAYYWSGTTSATPPEPLKDWLVCEFPELAEPVLLAFVKCVRLVSRILIKIKLVGNLEIC